MDADGNGTVSLNEFTAAHKKRLEIRKKRMGDKWDESRAAKMPSPDVIFKKIDADENGELTSEEMRAAHKKRIQARKGAHKCKRDGSAEGCPLKKKDADVEEGV